ncbi:MAG: hypothetical protein KME45_04690 [Stenomitos rutilans HA7619-LM2]|jgi:hypothetical protein|nr:hypothetical protein [Stenomitos rutilans HA7619-LM2]
MYGILESLPLAEFVGQAYSQIRLSEFQIQFYFSDGSSIDVESKWELWNRDHVLVDQFILHAQRERYCVHKLLEYKVCSFSINVPTSFSLYFENEFALTISDDSEQYESFSLHSNGGSSTHV